MILKKLTEVKKEIYIERDRERGKRMCMCERAGKGIKTTNKVALGKQSFS